MSRSFLNPPFLFGLLLALNSSSLFSDEDFNLKGLEKAEKIFENLKDPAPTVRKNSFAPSLIEDINKAKSMGTKQVYLKKGTPLLDLNSKETFILPRSSFVQVSHYQTAEQFHYIIPKSQQIAFKVKYQYLHSIEDVGNLRPQPSQYSTYERPKEAPTFLHDLNLDQDFFLHYEKAEMKILNHWAQSSHEKTDFYTLESNTLFRWYIPLDLGPAISYQQGQLSPSEKGPNQFTTKALFLGLIIRHSPISFMDLKLVMNKSLFYHVDSPSIDPGPIHLSTYAFRFGPEFKIKTSSLLWKVGLSYNKYWFPHNFSEFSGTENSHHQRGQSISLYVGTAFENIL